MNTILNDQCGSPWIYTLQPVGRGIFVVGHLLKIRAWDLRHAIKLARARVSRAWSLRLVSVQHGTLTEQEWNELVRQTEAQATTERDIKIKIETAEAARIEAARQQAEQRGEPVEKGHWARKRIFREV